LNYAEERAMNYEINDDIGLYLNRIGWFVSVFSRGELSAIESNLSSPTHHRVVTAEKWFCRRNSGLLKP